MSWDWLAPAARAREAGWAIEEIEAGRFHMLVEPEVVTDALLRLIGSSL
jgi:hypothetical protein